MYLTENQLSTNEVWCVADNQSYTCHICAKEFSDTKFNEAVTDKISKLPQISHIHKIVIFKV